MRNLSIFRKILSLVVIVALLALRLSNFTEKEFVIPVEDNIFDVPFIAAENSPADGKPPKIKPKRVFDIIFLPDEEQCLKGERFHIEAKPVITAPSLKDIYTEIFIPPETVS